MTELRYEVKIEYWADQILKYAKEIKGEIQERNLLAKLKYCVCGKCGEQVLCDHAKGKAHDKSLCGNCA